MMVKIVKRKQRNPMLAAALNLVDDGFAVLPLCPRGKIPLLSKKSGGNGCKDATVDLEQVNAWWEEYPDANIGIATGPISGIIVLDIDLPDGPESFAKLESMYGGGDIVTTLVETGGGGLQAYFLCPNFDVRNSAGKIGKGLDIRGTGGYVVAPPSIHPSGQPYVGKICREEIAEAPEWLLRLLRESVCPGNEKALPAGGTGVPYHIPEGRRNDAMTRLAGSLRRKGLGEDAILAALVKHNLVACHPPLDDEEVVSIARSIGGYPVGDGESAAVTYDPFDLTDVGNANRFVEQFGAEARYCTPMGNWWLWTGRRWREDHSKRVLVWAKKVPAAIYDEASAEVDPDLRKSLVTHARRTQSAGKLRAMIELSAPELPLLPAELDRDAWSFNVANGTLDLRTGELRPPSRDDFLSKIAPVTFDPKATAPMFEKFLKTVTDGDEEFVGFLRRIAGYSLTGDTSERCIFLFCGGGANGKSTFVSVLQALLGEYALATPVETLMVTRSGGVPNDIARLRGARLVATSEGEMGQRLAESLVKRLTGRDTIVARFLHREFFEFDITAKIFFSTNHKPQIRGADDGVWDRIRMVPFSVRIAHDQQDKSLLERLRHELPGILNWALAGCLEWQQLGSLAAPRVVTEATEAYRQEMDVVGAFLDEETVVSSGSRTSSAELFARFGKWAEQAGEAALSRKMFGTLLHERGLKSIKSNGYHYWEGLAIKRTL